MTQHFLKLSDITADQAKKIVARATELKQQADLNYRPLLGRSLAMVFAKNSTRTRVSFEVGMQRFGGHAIFLSPESTQIGRSEPIGDTARVLSRMCDAIMVRNDSQQQQEEFAAHSAVPVINGLSELHHPCQLLADLQCWTEHRGSPSGKTAAWIGDGNNMCHSWIEAAQMFDFKLKISTPTHYEPDSEILKAGRANAIIASTPEDAVADADVVITDTWTSMGQEAEQKRRLAAFSNYEVNEELMSKAKQDVIFMHCLPAHRGEEVSASVIDGPQSVVWDEAENRLWAQMALLEFLLVS